ncbi:ABC transporter permease [Desulfospira joergensenii]|uniref:ABC transporter permease n=1 Tax=Desulfospira joergensenii TaxID=53329 RepID=UPI0003B37797|nr:ABC transporter permease [Desulfospira joergensenii]
MTILPHWIKHLAYTGFVLWGVSLCTFILFALSPGDPAEIILSAQSQAPGREQIEALRHSLALDRHWTIQYLSWMGRICSGDFGQSWQTGRPVFQEISLCLTPTLELALAAFLMVVLLSGAGGMLSAVFRHRSVDHLIAVLTVVSSAMPPFWLGIMLVWIVSLQWGLLPVGGQGSVAHVILPAFSLALGLGLLQGSMLRSALIRTMEADFIGFARTRGLGAVKIFFRHILPHALVPMISLWGVCLGQLLGGAMIVESVFARPGLGRLMVQAVMARDIPMVQALVLLICLIFVSVNRLADFIHWRLDPQMGAGL